VRSCRSPKAHGARAHETTSVSDDVRAGRNKSKGIFGGLFSKKQAPSAETSAAKTLASTAPARPQSAAAAAASRWIRGGAGETSTGSLADASTSVNDNPTTSLLAAKVRKCAAEQDLARGD